MATKLEQLFPPESANRVMEMVRNAELGTSGEIVPFVVERSDEYNESIWRTASFGVTILLVVLGLLPLFTPLWPSFGITTIASIAIAAGMLIGILLSFSPSLRVFFASSETKRLRAAQRAAEAFISEEVFNTRDRSGILIFLSLCERQVVVMGDTGINAEIDQSEWNGLVETTAEKMRKGAAEQALGAAIAECGRLLVEHRFVIKDDDRNELPDTLRFDRRK